MNADSTSPQFIVLKFGGTSVARPATWHHIAELADELEGGPLHPVVVCSALSGVTNLLEAAVLAVATGDDVLPHYDGIHAAHASLADALDIPLDDVLGDMLATLRQRLVDAAPEDAADGRWRAETMANGELMSTRLGVAHLQASGRAVRWLDARTVLRATDDSDHHVDYLSVACCFEPQDDVRTRLGDGTHALTVTQGFIAANDDGETVLLGRGGSDTSAAYFASILRARRLEIWTDVPGLFTADPRHVESARMLESVTYDEAQVLGSLGAKVLHPRCLEPVRNTGIPLHIRWTQHPEVDGTAIEASVTDEDGVRAITSRSGLCMIRMQRERSWQPVGFMAHVSSQFQKHGISMDLVSASASEIRATIDLKANPAAGERLDDLMVDLAEACEPTVVHDLVCISIVGSGISGELARISSTLELFGRTEVHLVTFAADDSHLSFVVDASAGPALVGATHDVVFGDAEPGTLGETLKHLRDAAPPMPAEVRA